MLVGNAFLERYNFNLFLKQVRFGAEWITSFKSVGALKAKLWPKCFVDLNTDGQNYLYLYCDTCLYVFVFCK